MTETREQYHAGNYVNLVETILDRAIFADGSELVIKVRVPPDQAEQTTLATLAYGDVAAALDAFREALKRRGGV